MSGVDDFEEFVRARTPALLRAAYLLTGDQHAAEDLVQGALERTALRWRHIDHSGGADAYVRTVMYRLQVDRWRRRGRIREDAVAVVPERSAGDAYGGTELKLALRTALLRLTPRQRAVIVLRFYEDLSEERTADLLGCARGTVKSTTSLALRRLRETSPDLAALFTEGVLA